MNASLTVTREKRTALRQRPAVLIKLKSLALSALGRPRVSGRPAEDRMSFCRVVGCVLALGMFAGAPETVLAVVLPGGGTTGPSCLPGQVRHCTLGPPPVCSCSGTSVKNSVGTTGINKNKNNKNSNTGRSAH